MNKNSLIRTAAPLAAALVLAGCVDDKYDLTDIDTTSRITVDNLTIPVNLGEIELENVLELDDNENISIINNQYVIRKDGKINTSEFKIHSIKVNPAAITPSTINVPTLGMTVSGSQSFSVTASEKSNYDISLLNVDETLISVADVKTAQPIEMKITLEVPSALASGGNSVKFENFKIQLPWGLTEYVITGADAIYEKTSGIMTVNLLAVDTNGKGIITIKARGIELGEKGTISSDRKLSISGQVGIDGGDIEVTANNVKLPDPIVIKASYVINAFELASFSGMIDYRMDDISIAPISLNDLPDFLNSPETKIYLADPSIMISVNNPVGQYGISGTGNLKLISYFDKGNQTIATSDAFMIGTNGSDISLGAGIDGTTTVAFPGLGGILANDNEGGLPGSVKVSVENLSFAGKVTDFPIAHGNLGSIEGATGEYVFNAPLAFERGTYIVYEYTEGDWGGDVENIHINQINLTANCHTDLPVGLELQVLPIDKNGNVIAVDEDSSKFKVPANCDGQPVALTVRGKNGAEIHNFDGIKFRAVITQENVNSNALRPDLHIMLSNLRVTVDGYFEKSL